MYYFVQYDSYHNGVFNRTSVVKFINEKHATYAIAKWNKDHAWQFTNVKCVTEVEYNAASDKHDYTKYDLVSIS